jgi:hypothetical protein
MVCIGAVNGYGVCKNGTCLLECQPGYKVLCGTCVPESYKEKCGGCYAEFDPDHCGDQCLACWAPTKGAQLSCTPDKPGNCCYKCAGSMDTCCVPSPPQGNPIKCWEMNCL